MNTNEKAASFLLQDAWNALQFIPAHDRDVWIKIGMALKAEYADDAFAVFDAWSSSADNYDKKSVESAWRSFHGNQIGIGTLIYLAKTNGSNCTTESFKALPPVMLAPGLQQKDTTVYAKSIWLSAKCSDQEIASHSYAKKKGITHSGGTGRGKASGSLIGRDADCLIVPIRNIKTNKLQGVQCINAQGYKQTFGKLSGGCLLLGNTLDKKLKWYVSEGWASAYSIVFHHQRGNGVCAVSFGKHQLDFVANQIATVYQPNEIIILEEIDA